MASAQVLPSSRKQEHLEAGKRRLEEFRKKKAAERAKKAAATSQPLASNASVDQKQPLEAERARLTDSDAAGTSDGPGRTIEPIDIISTNDHVINTTQKFEPQVMKDSDSNPPSLDDYKNSLPDMVQRHTNNYDFSRNDVSGFAGGADGNGGQEYVVMSKDSKTYFGSQSGVPYGILSGHSIVPQSQENQGKGSVFTLPQDSASSLQTKISSVSTQATDVDFVQPGNNSSESSLQVEQDTHGGMSINGLINSNFRERSFRGSPGGFPSVFGRTMQTSESIGLDSMDSDVRISSNHVPLYSGTSDANSRRSRPSFLDSLNVSRASSGTSFQRKEPQESFMPRNININGIDGQESTTYQSHSVETGAFGQQWSSYSTNGTDFMASKVDQNGFERKHESHSSKQNEDFAALEQHIEDLTQEKFSLQRALEASRALAESLAAENSSLTDNYNQQRSFVNQLKSDMEKLQQEIKAHLVELESVKMEYANAKLECNAADERSKILASEVIGLEEKALRLRSNELKLERQLENSHAELASYKKKMSSLEKDRQDLQSTIDALQEEKKLLQSKLRKASGSGKPIEVDNRVSHKKDMSTSTEDLDVNPDLSTQGQGTYDTESLTGNDHMLPENGQSNLQVSSVYIPSDQMRMIENINTLISELALEKEELIHALASESSQCSRLKDINNELSRKLEAQTQRLELLTAQSMVNENAPARLPDSRTTQENTAYADEGDEVVERVLGWIMKLFPGGPSKRRTSKLL